MEPKLLDILDMESFAQLFSEILEDLGREVISAENGKILEMEDLAFSYSRADRTLRGPYPSVYDLVNEEGEEVFLISWDGNGPAHTGSNEVYKWNGHYLVHMGDFGWSDSVYSDLEEALRSEDLQNIGDADQSVGSSELTYEELIRILKVHPDMDPPESLLVNGRPWVPKPGP